MRPTIITKLALVALLWVCVGGCQKQDKPGEAFVVLKSGEVIYMADMEVVCLKPSFKSDFNGLKNGYESKNKSLIRGIEAGSPAVKAKLKEIDDDIVELNAKISAMSGDEKAFTDNLVRTIEYEQNKLVAEIAKTNVALEEFKQIIDPIDKRVGELEAEAPKAIRELHALATETIQKINANIVESKLTVPMLKFDDEIEVFATTEGRTYNSSSTGRPERHRLFTLRGVSNPFLVEMKPHDSGSDWVFLTQVPGELEGGQIDADVKAAYQKWCALSSRVKSLAESVRGQNARKDEELIPWKNRHGKSESDGEKMVELEAEQRILLAILNEKLGILQKTGGAEAKALVQTEIARKVAAPNESVASLNKRRKAYLQEATEKAKGEVAVEFRKNTGEFKFFFNALLKKDTFAAVRTGSKGDFIVPGGAGFIFAETQRDNGEKLAWLVHVDPKSPKVKLSVSNAASAGGNVEFDDFWMLRWSPAE